VVEAVDLDMSDNHKLLDRLKEKEHEFNAMIDYCELVTKLNLKEVRLDGQYVYHRLWALVSEAPIWDGIVKRRSPDNGQNA
jgi:hypothetical protein